MRRASTPIASAAADLDQIATAAASDIAPQTLERIRELIDVTSDRSEIDPTWCVIGMLGGTGAGKSSLVNALAGGEVVRAGVLRPTTNEPCAVLPRGRAPKELLGWLGVSRRVDAPGDLAGETAIIDLPDIDSVEVSHGEVAGRLASRVDALVVVVNPQKYADARLHDEWLARLRSSHASVTVVLTHIDTLGQDERASIEADLRRLLDARGLAGASIVAVSPVTGEGIDILAAHLARESARVSGQAIRARAALAEAARLVRDAVGVSGTIRGVETEGMASDLAVEAADLAGAPVIAEAVAASTLRAGRRVGGWLPLRWLARVGVDPLRRLHLGEENSQESATTPTLPTRCASDDAAFANAVRREVAARSVGRPDRWRGLLIERALSGANDVPAAAHRELSANLRVSAAPPLAARVFGAAQLVAWLCVLIGAAWIVLVHLGRAVLIDAVVPAIGPIPVPTAVIACAVAVSLLCAGLSRACCAWVASRRKRAVMEDIRSMCRDEVERRVIAPLRAEDNRQVSIASFVARLHLDERV